MQNGPTAMSIGTILLCQVVCQVGFNHHVTAINTRRTPFGQHPDRAG